MPSSVLGLEREVPQCGRRGGVGAVTPGEGVVELDWRPTDTPVIACTIWETNWSFSAQFPVSGIAAALGALGTDPTSLRHNLRSCPVCCLLRSQRGVQWDLPSPVMKA